MSKAVTSRPCSASQTLLRPSPSATHSARCPGLKRPAFDARKALGAVPKMYSGAEKRSFQRASSAFCKISDPIKKRNDNSGNKPAAAGFAVQRRNHGDFET